MKKPPAEARAAHTLNSVFKIGGGGGGGRGSAGNAYHDDDADSNDSFPSSSQDKDSFRLHHPARRTSYKLQILKEVQASKNPFLLSPASLKSSNPQLSVYATLPCPYTSPDLVIQTQTKGYYNQHGDEVEEEVVVEEEEEDQVSRYVVTDEFFLPSRGLERARVCLVSMSSGKGGGGGGWCYAGDRGMGMCVCCSVLQWWCSVV